MKNKNENKLMFGLGCEPSVIDGTEHKFEYVRIQLPKTFNYAPLMPPILNQGKTNKCVCYSLTAYLDWRKNAYEGDNNGGQFSIDELYDIRDNKPLDRGMSIKKALSYLKHNGLNGTKIDSYALLDSVESVKYALVMNGPCAAGLPFYSSQPEFWKHGTQMKGGHCVLFVGYNEQGFILRNSWGKNYGDNGYIIFPFSDFDNRCFECWTMI